MNIDDLKCCGNCDNFGIDAMDDDEYGSPICLFGFGVAYYNQACDKWKYDAKTWSDRT